MPSTTAQPVQEHLLKNAHGTTVGICNYGACITKFILTKNGIKTDIVLGFDDLNEYKINDCFVGVTVGRFANRIAKASYILDNQKYHLEKNNNQNSLHSGSDGFHHQIWDILNVQTNTITLTYFATESEAFPGNVEVKVTFTLNESDELNIHYQAISDKNTIINLTNHSYFNLNGFQDDSCLEHLVKIHSDAITEMDEESIPSGKLLNVTDTPFDFREFKEVGIEIENNHEQIKYGGGYDHNFVVNQYTGELQLIAQAIGNKSHFKLSVFSTEPGLQFYTGNFLNNAVGKMGIKHKRRSAFCFETQHFPDSPNQNLFPSTLLKKGEKFTSTTIYKIETN